MSLFTTQKSRRVAQVSEENLIDTFMFERDIVRDKVFDNDYSVVLVKED